MFSTPTFTFEQVLIGRIGIFAVIGFPSEQAEPDWSLIFCACEDRPQMELENRNNRA